MNYLVYHALLIAPIPATCLVSLIRIKLVTYEIRRKYKSIARKLTNNKTCFKTWPIYPLELYNKPCQWRVPFGNVLWAH